MKYSNLEINLIDLALHLERELDTAYPEREQSTRDSSLSHNICLAFGVPNLGPIINPLIDSGAEFELVESTLAESGYTFADLEQYRDLLDLVRERSLVWADSASQWLLDHQRELAGPDCAELIHFPTHRTVQ